LTPNNIYGQTSTFYLDMLAYGPVPSRRLGRSLGINHVPPKICTYSCVYCQLGRTNSMRCERHEFYPPEEIVREVRDQVNKTWERGERIDYLTFVPDGEPTLDANLGEEIRLLKPLGVRTAILSNASLMWRDDVREDLLDADWVSLKVDAVTDETWRKVDRPHGKLIINDVLDGMREFAEVFEGELATETMLVKGLNDGGEEATRVADFLGELNPDKAYLAIPTRPPAEPWVEPPYEEDLNRAYQIFADGLRHVEYLIGYEGNAFASTGRIEEDLLSITSVHPMREEGVKLLLSKSGSDWSAIETMIEEEKLLELQYRGKRFFMRRLPSRAE